MKRIYVVGILALGLGVIVAACGPQPDKDNANLAPIQCASANIATTYWDAYRMRFEDGTMTVTRDLAFEQNVPNHERSEFHTAVDGALGSDGVSLTFKEGQLTASPTSIPGILTGTVTVDGDFDLPVVCYTNGVSLPHSYDVATGSCSGFNDVPVLYIRETQRGECARVSEGWLNGDNFGYPILRAWDLRGADLSGASLHFADLLEADLRGAKLDALEFGYARVEGTIDEHTVVPINGSCTTEGEQIACLQ